MWGHPGQVRRAAGLLGRLQGDRRGNTLAMMAAFMIPLSALAGSAVDMGRLYLVKVRLQQACDAGALAGRKFMADGASTTLDENAVTQARTFFANNFPSGFMGTPAYTRTTNPYPFVPSKTADNQVAATATTTVPMTIMKMFSSAPVTLNITCEARYDIADTDVMFVLDTTGSMACQPSQTAGCSPVVQSYTRPDGTTGYYATEVSGSKLSGLRSAVLNFYDTVAASADPSTNIRYGFVTYTSTVNAGYAVRDVSTDYLVDAWDYESRRVVGDHNNGSATSTTTTGVSQSNCNARATGRNPTSGYSNNGQAVFVSSSWSASNNTCVVTTQPLKPAWNYGQYNYDVRQFVAGATVLDPSKVTGATAKWQGCVEERDTVVASSFDPDNLPPDLDPDLVPTSNATRWRPMWPEVVYYRGTATAAANNGITPAASVSNSTSPYGDYFPRLKPPASVEDQATTAYTNITPYAANGWDNNIASGYVSCGKPVQRLATLSRSQISDYVNASDFRAQGGTYHDTGMIWGTRLISPSGIFARDTNAWPGRNPPNRYIVFMTDGDMAPNFDLYGMYGIERYDKRVTGGNSANQTNYHNARFLAECEAAKSRNITVFVVGFGQTLTSQLNACASPGQAYYASDNATLTSAFQTIAKQVAMLRISK